MELNQIRDPMRARSNHKTSSVSPVWINFQSEDVSNQVILDVREA